MQKPEIKGIVPAIVTPTRPESTLDEDGLRRVIEHNLAAGVDGLFVLGSTGRFNVLTDVQRRRVVEITADVLREKSALLFAGISDTGLSRSVEQAKMVDDLAVDYYVALPPLYEEYDQARLKDYFSRLADSLKRPLIIYHIPQRTPSRITPATVSELAEHGNIAGIKDSSSDVLFMNEMLNLHRLKPRFAYLNGAEHLLLQTLVLGGNGLVGGVAGVFPTLAVEVYRAWQREDLARAVKAQSRLTRMLHLLSCGGYSALAMACRELGLCENIAGESSISSTAANLTPSQMAYVRQLIEESRAT